MNAPRRLGCADVEELTGLLVLGALAPDDRTAVAAHLADCPEAHETVTLLAPIVSGLAVSAAPRAIPPGLRERVLGAVAGTPQVADMDGQPLGRNARAGAPARDRERYPMRSVPPRPVGEVTGEHAHGPAGDPQVAGRSARRSAIPALWGGRPMRWAIVGAGALVIVLVAVGVLSVLERESVTASRLALLRAAVVAAADPSGDVARLEGSGPAEGAGGFAVFPDGGAGFIVIDGLAQAPEGSAYQAWYIADGAPVSAGLVDMSRDGLGTLTGLDPVSGTHTIALTVEALPGAEAPSGAPIVVGELALAP